jgi:hypothetical protein
MDFYLWQHKFLDEQDRVITRTCFGITGNRDNRINGYEGHVGHAVKFQRLWTGPDRLIRELEDRIKRDFHDYLVTGHRGFRYEWINEDVEFDQIVQYVEWEISQLDGIEPVVSEH